MVMNPLKDEGIDKRSPIPMYYQIMRQLLEKIQSGAFAVDSLLPPERELAETYKVSRMTVRQAIIELVNEGILVRSKGIGTFVAPPKLEQALSRLTSFTEDMARRGLKAGARVISFEEIVPEPVIRKTLGLGSEDKAYECVRVRLADDEPMALETTTLPVWLCPGLSRQDLEDQSLYHLLADRWGVRLDYATQSLEPACASPYEASLLHVEAGTPLLLMHRITHNQNGRAVEHVKSLYRGDRYKFIIELHQKPAL
ncbi:MAG TPA: GntR family transcriptional regulator [Ktedonobacteraceae bacterium]|nr:GntR family transcriptional regulator [Ktedonobacteraceae bacterium]